MSEWEPATDAEVAMRDALRTDDQESYFRILSGVDLLLPVSADALAGLAPLGWGTWSTGGRTHVLAFTSTAALQACLADYTGSARRVPYAELANTWPNLEWWLAVNPGLPIEGYLPAWFVAQLSRGDLRLPTRGPGRAESRTGNSKVTDLQAAAMAANAAAAGQEEAARPGGPTHEGAPLTSATGSYPQYPAAAQSRQLPGAPAAYGQAAANTYGGAYAQPAGQPPASELPARTPDQPPGGGLPTRTPSVAAPAGLPTRTPSAAPDQPPAGGLPTRTPADQPPAGGLPTRTTSPAPSPAPAGGLPTRTTSPAPSPAPAGGLPTRTPGQPPANGLPTRTPPAFGQPAAAAPASAPPAANRPASAPPSPVSAPPPYGRPASAPPAYGQPTSPAAAGHAPARPGFAPAAPEAPGPKPEQVGPGGLPVRTPGTVLPSGLPARGPASAPAPPISAPPAPPLAVPTAYQPPPVPPASIQPPVSAPTPDSRGPVQDPRGPGLDERRPAQDQRGPVQDPRGALQDPSGPLPVRTPMAQTPPVPDHIAPHDPEETPFNPSWSPPSGALGDLPRRRPSDAQQPSGFAAPPTGDRQPGGFPQGPASPQAAQRTAPPVMPPISAPPAPPAPPAAPIPQTPPAATSQAPAAAPQVPAAAPQAPAAAPQPPVAATSPAPAAATSPAPAATPQTPPTTAPQPVTPAEPGRGFGTPLPRRQATQASDRPGLTSFPAFQTRAETAPQPMSPPVIPGSPGSDRPARLGAQPPLEQRTPAPPPQPEVAFVPANDVEQDLFEAASRHNTDAFLSTLLLATVLVPVANHSRPGSAPGESGFAFRTEQMDGETFLIVFTSRDRLSDHFSEPTRTVNVRFIELIRNWPDPGWSFAVNPTGPIGAKYPGPQVIALANWAAESGLGTDPDGLLDEAAPVPAPEPASDDAQHATVMQKTLPPEQVDYYLERGYDRVAGFVHRATEVEHLRTPGELFAALGLSYDTSPHQPDAKEAYVLRWPAYRPSLYRIPYGGQNEQALRAMDGWVIERAPFRGNGFAPGEGRDVIAEFKVDSVRLPHGAQLWRIDADGSERMIAIFDNDGPLWRRVGEQ
ncbi:SseB family protein [Actinoplanes sp. URMC 104]|uniref:SseB family protein n=1 Tax=Actinoplanes sp. URMC 104 TaxID=3423409 RepID=UPI003F196E43